MRGLKRNETAISYRPYTGETDTVDENGLLTGGKTVIYGDPAPIRGSVSGASGRVGLELFGTSLEYDYVIVSHDKDLPVKEEDLILLDDATCVIERVRRTLNVTAIAVRQVTTDAP